MFEIFVKDFFRNDLVRIPNTSLSTIVMFDVFNSWMKVNLHRCRLLWNSFMNNE